FHYTEMWNEPRLHAIELPSSNSIARASSVARLYAALLGFGDGPRLLSAETVAAASAEVSRGKDAVLLIETAYGSGFQLPPLLPSPVGRRAFGHSGAGGAMSFADPDASLAFAYIPNKLRMDLTADPRTEAIAKALYEAHTRAA